MFCNTLYFGVTLLNSWLLNYSIASVTAVSTLNTNFNEIGELVNLCFSKSRLVGLIGDPRNFSLFPNSMKSYLRLRNSMSNQSYATVVQRPIPHKVDVYVLIASSSNEVISVLQRLKKSAWSHLEKPLIISTSGKNNATDNCKKARLLLSAAWKEDTVHAIFVCKYFEKTLLFTYNEYNGNVPDRWKCDNSQTGSRGVLCRQEYTSNADVCHNLMYDKTEALLNYPFNVGFVNHEPYVHVQKNENRVTVYNGIDIFIIALMNRYLNTKLHIFVAHIINSTNSLKDFSPLLPALQLRHVDLILNSLHNRNVPDVSHTYPIFWTGLSCVTRRKNWASSLEKILHFMPPHIMLILLMSGVLAHLILCYGFRDTFKSTMSIVQLVLSIPTTQVPRTTPGRIFLSTILILFFITNSVFQGNLAKLLTVPREKPNVEKLIDLDALGYTVIGDKDVKQLLGDDFHGNFVSTTTIEYNCRKLRENEAYIDDEFRLQCISSSTICHIPKNYFLTIYKFYYVRSNWPLLPRVNRFLLTIFEGGIVHKIRDDVMNYYKALHRNLWKSPLEKSKPLALKNLWFAFVLLLIGNLCALIVFLLEIAYAYCKGSTSKNCGIPQKTQWLLKIKANRTID